MADLSSRYAASLFDLAMESGALDQNLEQAAVALETLQTGSAGV